MKVIYMGTPDFAVPALKALCEKGYEVTLVVSQPDKAKDRGRKVQHPPVKTAALELGIPVSQPEKVKNNPEFLAELSALQPDMIVVAAYGRILPKEILTLPRLGCINIHASLLPRYRGAAPIHRAVINGEAETGVTLMYMEEGLDTGDMIAKVKTPVADKTTAQLHDELAALGAELLVANLPALEAGTNSREKQDDALACYAPMVFKQEGVLDFSQEPVRLACLIRGFNSWPGASTVYKGQPMKVWEAEALDKPCNEPGGTVIQADQRGIAVSAGGKILLITRIQMPGKKAMSVEDYLRGNEIEISAVLG